MNVKTVKLSTRKVVVCMVTYVIIGLAMVYGVIVATPWINTLPPGIQLLGIIGLGIVLLIVGGVIGAAGLWLESRAQDRLTTPE